MFTYSNRLQPALSKAYYNGLFGSSTRDRHDAYIGGCSKNNIKCVLRDDLGGRTKQLDIFCRVTGFTCDFLSYIVVEHIRFFHRALQSLCSTLVGYKYLLHKYRKHYICKQ